MATNAPDSGVDSYAYSPEQLARNERNAADRERWSGTLRVPTPFRVEHPDGLSDADLAVAQRRAGDAYVRRYYCGGETFEQLLARWQAQRAERTETPMSEEEYATAALDQLDAQVAEREAERYDDALAILDAQVAALDRPADADPAWPMLNALDLSVSWDDESKPEMLVPDFIPLGELTTLFGEAGAGKTMFALAAAVAPLLRARRTVVYCDKEMSRRPFIDRLKSLGVERELVGEFFVYLELPMLDASAASLAQWKEMLFLRGPALVVVDAAAGVLADADLNENQTGDVLRWISLYLEPARRAGATVLLLDHSGHDNKERTRGASGKKGVAKVRFLLERVHSFGRETIGEVRLTLEKDNLATDIPKRQNFRLGGEDGRFVFERLVLSDDDTETGDFLAARDRIRGDVESRVAEAGEDGLTSNQLVDLVTGRAAEVRAAAKDLVDDSDSPVQSRPQGRSILYYSTASSPDPDASRPGFARDGLGTRSDESTSGTRPGRGTRSKRNSKESFVRPFTTPDE